MQESPTRAPKFHLAHHEEPGKFVAVDGMDGAGITGLVRRITNDLESEGYEVVRVRMPTDRMRKSWMFQRVHQQNMRGDVDPLAFEVAHMADRLQLSRNVVGPALSQGKIVISDRYLISSIGSLLVRAPELRDVIEDSFKSRGWFSELTKKLVKPDLSVFLYADADVAIERILKKKSERSFDIESSSYQQVIDLGKSLALANDMTLIDTSDLSPTKTFDSVKLPLSNTMRW